MYETVPPYQKGKNGRLTRPAAGARETSARCEQEGVLPPPPQPTRPCPRQPPICLSGHRRELRPKSKSC
jgi:hypothetical protein